MRLKLLAAGCALAALLPAAALAQASSTAAAPVSPASPDRPMEGQAEPQSAVDNDTQVGEVIVTARRREERLRDVPVAVTALNGDALTRSQITNVREAVAASPGVVINSDSVGRAFVSIRGIGTTLIDTVQPGVGIFIDGVYQPNTSYLNSPIVDVERIEVLRGPQGTLFGNNTLGGAINIVTRQPSNEFRARFNAAYAGPDDFQQLSGSVSGPILQDRLFGRIGAAYHSRDGFVTNTLAGGDQLPLETRSVNGTLRFLATDWATFSVNASYDRVEGGNTAYSGVTGPRDYTETARTNQRSLATLEYRHVDLRGDFDLRDINTNVTAVYAHDTREGVSSGDGDYGPVDFIRSAGSTDLETNTFEIRADTDFGNGVSTLIGAFASRYETAATTTNRLIPLGVTSTTSATSRADYRALFATAFLRIDDRTDLSLGIRADWQTVDASNAGGSADYEAAEVEPRITLTRRWTPDFMTYASIARGFRGGGQNGPGAPNLIYEGDSVTTYEVGTKFRMLDRALDVQAAVFYNDYNNFIGQNSLAPSTTGVGFVAINLNTGDVRSYGVEVEAHWRVTDRLRIDGGLTLLNARITDDGPYRRTTGTGLPSGRIIFTPDYTFNLAVNYTIPLGVNAVVLDAGLIGKGDRLGSTFDPTFAPELEGYVLANASVAYRFGNAEIALFGTNVFDEEYIESYIDRSVLVRAGLAAIAQNVAIQGDRRRVGVRVSWRY